MICGYHGTGKSTHVEQVAARLNWPCIRVNLDSHISRIDLVGKDAIVLRDSKQVTEFREGILPWALQHPVALCFDEYDAGRPDVMFVIQRVLEVEGKLTLLDQNRVIRPHRAFRLFSTANTVGLGDTTGLYHGTQQINQGQMDRWNIVATLNYLPHDAEVEIVLSKVPSYDNDEGRRRDQRDGGARRSDPQRLHQRRHLDRHVAAHGDDLGRERAHLQRPRLRASALTFLNKCDEMERLDRGGILPALLRHRTAGDRRQRDVDVAESDGRVMAQEFSPTEIFKRATASTLRAIAERDDLTVGFGPEPPGLSGTRVKLPNPARDLPAEEAAQLRGAADSLALRVRYHDVGGALKAAARQPDGARRVRGARNGAGRGAGLAAHGRGRPEPDRDARRAISPPGFRADHRAHRKHDGRGRPPADPRGA